MQLSQLCELINLQTEIRKQVESFFNEFDFEKNKEILFKLKNSLTEKKAREELKEILSPDEKNLKMLSCMLYCALQEYDLYQKKGIPQKVFVDTMKCFTRFIEECKEITGEYAFDREWWTVRQISGHLFRIGSLEYEMREWNRKDVISIHIPSDADFSIQNCKDSIAQAKEFFKKYFVVFSKVKYICNSWLLSPELSSLLSEESNILKFQKLFNIYLVSYDNDEYIQWVFKKRNCELTELPEKTLLQKNMKKLLLSGETIGTGCGVLIEE